MKKIRVIIYESEDENWIERTFEKSLPIGITFIADGKTITVLTEKEIKEDKELKKYMRERLFANGNSLLFSKVDNK